MRLPICVLLSLCAASAWAVDSPSTPFVTSPEAVVDSASSLAAIQLEAEQSIATLTAAWEAEQAAILAAAEAERDALALRFDDERAAAELTAQQRVAEEMSVYTAAMQAVDRRMSQKLNSRGAAFNAAKSEQATLTAADREDALALRDRTNAVMDQVTATLLAVLNAPVMAELAELLPTDVATAFKASVASAITRIGDQRQQWQASVENRYTASLAEINAAGGAAQLSLLTAYNSDRAAIDAAARREKSALTMDFGAAQHEITVEKDAAMAAVDARQATAETGLATQRDSDLAALEQAHLEAVAAVEVQRNEQVAAIEAEARRRLMLSWTIPTSRVDGTAMALAELAGYELYYSKEDNSQSGVVAIAGGDLSSYSLSEIQPGVYFFAISAIDAGGLKSDLSPMVEVAVAE